MPKSKQARVVEVNAHIQGEKTVSIQLVEVRGDDIWNPEVEFFDGVSRCESTDKFDPDLGFELAYYRALERVAKAGLKRANGKVKHNDNVRASQERREESREDVEILDENTILYQDREYSSTWAFDPYDNSDEFSFGDLVTYKEDMLPSEFYGVVGMVLGTLEAISGLAVFHPDLDWYGNHITVVTANCLEEYVV